MVVHVVGLFVMTFLDMIDDCFVFVFVFVLSELIYLIVASKYM